MSEAPQLGMIDFVTHSTVAIATPASAVWAIIIDPRREGASMQLVHVDGDMASVGGRFHAIDASAPDAPLYAVVNAEVIPDRRRTIRLEGLDGTFMGFASWELKGEGPRTVLTYDVYCRYAGLPPGQSAADFMAASQGVMDESLMRIKAIVEAAG